MKMLEGYVKNRTKETALAAILIALFFVVRSFKIMLTPVFGVGLGATIIFAATSILSWPYTIVFSFASSYRSATIFTGLAYLAGTQVVFFLSKAVGMKRARYVPVVGDIIAIAVYGWLISVAGLQNMWIFLVGLGIVFIIDFVVVCLGGLLFWKLFTRFGIVEIE